MGLRRASSSFCNGAKRFLSSTFSGYSLAAWLRVARGFDEFTCWHVHMSPVVGHKAERLTVSVLPEHRMAENLAQEKWLVEEPLSAMMNSLKFIKCFVGCASVFVALICCLFEYLFTFFCFRSFLGGKIIKKSAKKRNLSEKNC